MGTWGKGKSAIYKWVERDQQDIHADHIRFVNDLIDSINERVKNVTDIVSEGDIVKVKLLGFDNRGKVKLSMKEVDQKTGKEIISDSEKISEEPPKEKKPKKAKKAKKAKEEDSD